MASSFFLTGLAARIRSQRQRYRFLDTAGRDHLESGRRHGRVGLRSPPRGSADRPVETVTGRLPKPLGYGRSGP